MERTVTEQLGDAAETTVSDRPDVGPSKPPDVIDDRYVLGPVLGEGGMGLVVRAVDQRLDRPVALKLLKRSASADVNERVRREARAVAQLSHPNVVQVFDVGMHDGAPYIVMELVPGESLRVWQSSTPRPRWRVVLRAYLRAGAGLACAHDAGIIHRDFKPANAIRAPDGRVRVLDFGLAGIDVSASLTDEAPFGLDTATLTRTGIVMGTPAYMAPEQHEGWPLTSAADVFAFAVSLYEALYGERPYRGNTGRSLAKAKRAGPQPPPEHTKVPEAIWPVLQRALEPDPEARWPSMAAMLRALKKAARRRSPRVVLGVGVVGLGLAGFLVQPTTATTCESASSRATDHWRSVRAEVGQRLDAAEIPTAGRDAVLESLGEYASDWGDATRAACRGSATADATRSCLEHRYNAWHSALSLMLDGDDQRVRGLASRGLALESLARCNDPALANLQPLPADPEQRAAVARVVDWTTRYKLTRIWGAPADRDRLEAVLAEAHALGHAPTIAQVEHVAGLEAMRRSDLADAEAALDRAVLHASEGGDMPRLVHAALMRAHALARLKRFDDAERARRQAHAHWSSVEGDPEDEVKAALADAGALLDMGRTEEALAIAEPWLEPDRYADVAAISKATLHSRVASAHLALGRPASAADHFAASLAIYEDRLSPKDPERLSALANLSMAQHAGGRLDDAVATVDRVLALTAELLPPEHQDRIFFESNAGFVLAHDPARRAEAITLLKDVVERAHTHASPMIQGQSLLGLAEAHKRGGQNAEAADAFRKAHVIAEAELGHDHPQTREIVEQLAAVEAAE